MKVVYKKNDRICVADFSNKATSPIIDNVLKTNWFGSSAITDEEAVLEYKKYYNL